MAYRVHPKTPRLEVPQGSGVGPGTVLFVLYTVVHPCSSDFQAQVLDDTQRFHSAPLADFGVVGKRTIKQCVEHVKDWVDSSEHKLSDLGRNSFSNKGLS